MRFDEFWKGQAAPTAAKAENLPHVPDGTHVGEIKYVDWREKERAKAPDNPKGVVLLVLVEVAGYAPVWVDVPAHYRGTIEAVCRSASIDPPDPSADWDCRALKGRTVTIETVHGIGKSGADYVRVEKWKAGPAPLPAEVRNAPPRSPAKKADAAAKAVAPDDIPF